MQKVAVSKVILCAGITERRVILFPYHLFFRRNTRRGNIAPASPSPSMFSGTTLTRSARVFGETGKTDWVLKIEIVGRSRRNNLPRQRCLPTLTRTHQRNHAAAKWIHALGIGTLQLELGRWQPGQKGLELQA
ncbi:MAG: hypothetical protein HW386_2035 [Gammaproteobacteria bacterium]|nr:hypothetical protein [Gammaproteobacteria bacterium]